jgi:hypothetical protein
MDDSNPSHPAVLKIDGSISGAKYARFSDSLKESQCACHAEEVVANAKFAG